MFLFNDRKVRWGGRNEKIAFPEEKPPSIYCRPISWRHPIEWGVGKVGRGRGSFLMETIENGQNKLTSSKAAF
jgi:hypothetical protein